MRNINSQTMITINGYSKDPGIMPETVTRSFPRIFIEGNYKFVRMENYSASVKEIEIESGEGWKIIGFTSQLNDNWVKNNHPEIYDLFFDLKMKRPIRSGRVYYRPDYCIVENCMKQC